MSNTIPVTQSELTRQERLLIWMRRTGKTNVMLAQFAGVSCMAVGRWMKQEALPWHRVQILRDFGIPEELLPTAQGMYGNAPPAAGHSAPVAAS